MIQTEQQWDALLGIKTSGRDDSRSNAFNYPYEPTPYCVLERLAKSEYIGKKNCLVDYGCGKGRVGLYLSYQTRCRSTGIEYDERLYGCAAKNKERGASTGRSDFVLGRAEEYKVEESMDRFYFFNPFSVEILQRVMKQILDSYYAMQRELLLFFYYPSDEYIAYLMSVEELSFLDEISCEDLFDGGDERERILVFEISYDN